MRTERHGTRAGYKQDRCRCERCEAANLAYQRRVRLLKHLGLWRPFVDAEPVRAHVNALRAAGMGQRTIARLSRVSGKTIATLIWGSPHDGLRPTKQVRAETADRLLAVQFDLNEVEPSARVAAVGARRRLQALTALGWPTVLLAERLDMHRSHLHAILRSQDPRKRLYASTVRAIRALYDDLWDQRPSASTPVEHRAITFALRRARTGGWPPPLAWDDAAIDDPDAEPYAVPAAARPGEAKLPAAEELLWLVREIGDAPELVADRFGVSLDAVQTAIRRAERKTETIEAAA